MKVEKIDLIWSVISMVIVGIAMWHRQLPKGIFAVYIMMAVLFGYHIWKKRKSLEDSVAVYGKVVDYQTSQKLRGSFPVVEYTTEDGKELTSVYSVVERRQRCSIGDEVMLCYGPDEPMSFYFAGREGELTQDYFRFIVFGAPIALVMLII